jgi:hypothetical protein
VRVLEQIWRFFPGERVGVFGVHTTKLNRIGPDENRQKDFVDPVNSVQKIGIVSPAPAR